MSVVPYTLPAEPGSRQWVELMQPAIELAKAVAGTDFVPKQMRNNPAAITAAVLYGDEVGLGPMQSLARISVIDGRPSLAAEAQRALILAAGHELWIEESTVTRCTVAGRRRDSDQTSRVTWTMDDAKRANLAGKQNWRQYPRQMLLARGSAELARAVFADAIGGLAATEELEGDDTPAAPATVAPLPAAPDGTTEPAKPTTRRKRARTTPAATVSAPAPAATEPELPPLPGEEEPAAMSEAQQRKLFALFKQRGLTERDDRLDWANEHLDRTVVSSAELTGSEASRLIDALEQEAEAFQALKDAEAPAVSEQQTELPVGTISRDRVDMLQHLRREANVTDAWIRARLQEAGVVITGLVDRAALASLTGPQAIALSDAMNTELDRLNEERGA